MILVTGGLGYIGSHTVVELQMAGFEVVIVDNLSNSKVVVLDRIKEVTGKKPIFVKGDIADETLLDSVFTKHAVVAVIHFAGFKAVGESVEQPLKYYSNNVSGSIVLLQKMAQYQCKTMVFSSSATVYGNPGVTLCDERTPLAPINPYGQSKLMVENILKDLAHSRSNWAISLLRYFNPVGAHESGLIGEDSNGIPNNLMPYISKVAVGQLPNLRVFGGNYPTKDGTGIRDYIHVEDLARGHILALNALIKHSENDSKSTCEAYNLGTGKGYSVLEVLSAFSSACGRQLPYEVCPRRDGDLAEYYAQTDKALNKLKFSTTKNLEDMVESHWRWQKNNINGYGN